MEYKARCHCGRVRFSFRGPEINTGRRCNCSKWAVFLLSLKSLLETGRARLRQTRSSSTAGNKAVPARRYFDPFRSRSMLVAAPCRGWMDSDEDPAVALAISAAFLSGPAPMDMGWRMGQRPRRCSRGAIRPPGRWR